MEKVTKLELNRTPQSPQEQFEAPETMEVDGEGLEVYDISPEELKTNTPLFVAPGWAATPNFLRENIVGLAEQGRRVLSIDSPHGVEVADKKKNYGRIIFPYGFDPNERATAISREEMDEVQLKKIEAFMRVLEEKGIDQVDVVAHSEAGINMILAAGVHPEKIRNIILVDPGGLTGQESPVNLATKFAWDSAKSIISEMKHRRIGVEFYKRMMRAGQEIAKSVAKDPISSFKEILAIARTQTPEVIKELRNLGKQIRVVHATDDQTFSADKLVENLGPDTVDEIELVKGSHGELAMNPEVMNRLLDEKLDAMEATSIQSLEEAA